MMNRPVPFFKRFRSVVETSREVYAGRFGEGL
jgi:hypothetical protein